MMAAPITSAGRFCPLGPLGILYSLVCFGRRILRVSKLNGTTTAMNVADKIKTDLTPRPMGKFSKITAATRTALINNATNEARTTLMMKTHSFLVMRRLMRA
jgi:hypothetical protein